MDASLGRVAVFFGACSALWLLAGSLFLLLASVKLHGPGMLADHAWLTYGRIQPAGWNMFVYGFVGQIAMAIGLWVLARAAMQRLQADGFVLLGGLAWNLGILVGVIGILAGYSTGYELLEMPAAAQMIMLTGAGIIGVCGWATFALRTRAETYPSAWFALLAFVAFAWAATAALLLLPDGVRGVIQVLVQRWYAAGVMRLWLAGFAVAVIFHFLPLHVRRPLASRELALWSFWTLVFFAPWSVTGHGDPFPRWVVSLGIAGKLLSCIGLLAIGMNWWKTVEGALRPAWSTLPGRLLVIGGATYILWGVMDLLATLRIPEAIAAGSLQFLPPPPVPSTLLRFTWLEPGLDWLLVGGAVMITLVAVLPEFMARASGRSLPANLVRLHAWTTLAGVALIALPLILAGFVQGFDLAAGSKTFMTALLASMNLVRVSSLGFTVFFVAQLIHFAAWVSVLRAMARDCAARARAAVAITPATPAREGVQS